jgi:hypothetical protein
MLTKTTAALTGALIFVSASALAAQPNRHAPKSPHWSAEASRAFGLSTTGSPVSGPHVFSAGRDQGWDPDGRVRLQLQRDPPFGG